MHAAYPTRRDYLDRYERSARAASRTGVLLPRDRDPMVERARARDLCSRAPTGPSTPSPPLISHVVPVTDELVASASELAADEGLRGYDAVHLAAALLIEATVLSSADTALCAAAARRGLHVANPLGS